MTASGQCFTGLLANISKGQNQDKYHLLLPTYSLSATIRKTVLQLDCVFGSTLR